jgi:CRISPR-associated protein Cas2
MYVILVYDIKVDDQGKRNLPRVHKICKKYLTHIQNSVFEGEITEGNLIQLKMELSKHVRKNEDSVIVFQSRDSRWLKKMFWGIEEDKTSRFI